MTAWSKAPEFYQGVGRRLASGIALAAERTAIYIEGRIKRRLSGPVLRYQSGALRNTVRVGVVVNGPKFEIVAQAGSPTVRYARIHEEGGTIMARSKKLFIPLKAGVVPGKREGDHVSRTGTVWRDRGKSSEAIAVLRGSVRMPARPYMRPSMQEGAAFLRARIVGVLKGR